jgi:hypothetical protein
LNQTRWDLNSDYSDRLLDDEVPHIFTRKPRLRPLEFLILGAKRFLQHNRSLADILGSSANVRIDRLSWQP